MYYHIQNVREEIFIGTILKSQSVICSNIQKISYSLSNKAPPKNERVRRFLVMRSVYMSFSAFCVAFFKITTLVLVYPHYS